LWFFGGSACRFNPSNTIESEVLMRPLIRIIALDECMEDVRQLRSCVVGLPRRRVSLQHLRETHDAVARLPRMRADVLFIDEDLARLTGVETIRSLRAAGELRPIVATTRVDCGYLAADLIRAGADAYLAKPDLTPEMVGHVLTRAMDIARERNACDRLHRAAVRRMIRSQGIAELSLR